MGQPPLPYDAKFTKCGDGENSFSFENYVFSNNSCLMFCSHGKGISDYIYG